MAKDNRSVPSSRSIAKWFEQSDRPIYLLDASNRIVFANPALAQMVDRQVDQLFGLDCSQIVSTDNHVQTDSAVLGLSIPGTIDRSQSQWIQLGLLGRDDGQAYWGFLWPLNANYRATIACLVFEAAEAKSLSSMSQEEDWQSDQLRYEVLRSIRRDYPTLDGLTCCLGSSASARRTLAQIQLAMRSDVSVWISGPDGSGKSDIARAIFRERTRENSSDHSKIIGSAQLFPIDCSLMDRSLLQNVLQMVSDAMPLRRAESIERFLLLERLDQLPLECHHLLAQYLNKARHPAIISTSRATDLQSCFLDSSDWKNIVAWTSVLPICIEPLSHRVDDIPILAEAILEQNILRFPDRPRTRIGKPALETLMTYAWPNNFRELESALGAASLKNNEEKQQSDLKTTINEIKPQDLPIAIRSYSSYVLDGNSVDLAVDLDKLLEDVERTLIERAMERFPRNRAAVARSLGISRARLLRRLEQLNIESTLEVDIAPELELGIEQATAKHPNDYSQDHAEESLPDFTEIVSSERNENDHRK